MGDRDGKITFDPDHYGYTMGMASAVCRRCGALVQPLDEARALHSGFHDQIAELIQAAEYERTLRLERE
jgi:hypothetical protein